MLQGFMTPLIASLAVYIAWQQWKANERKLVLDRYDRRLRMYQEDIAILSLMLQDFKPQNQDLTKFRQKTAEADFLFGPDIPLYIAEVYSRGLTLWRARAEYRDFTQVPPPGYDHQETVKDI